MHGRMPVAPQLRFELLSFDALDSRLLYAVLAARAQVFVVEQRCQYLDPDGKDLRAQHLLAFEGQALVAYLRIVPAGLSFAEVAIGRVLTLPAARGKGVGRALMMEALRCLCVPKPVPVSLSAQLQLLEWYRSMGFHPISEVYDDAGLPHISMRREALPIP